ncbi:molecular chaperone DnaJ [Phyllobacterium phragmitis]|uniref:Molecular chaperone DnaJ n=1 Tax=Phyllobacterium phragmitis TaxID=2670329 RepID=A0A2S9IV72_9HYPH|nr:J domain-containing protein [Phyllobacterium phragmitis]PRD44405.1 molecular chaperone DnaJ [Phyllobacterium phragmitis]
MKLNSKYFNRIRIRPEKEAEAPPRAPQCQWDGCDAPGTHRAPVGRMKEGEYFHFCIDHVRLYNKGFNYFSGLSDGEIARFQKEALTGHRPTWSAGINASAKTTPEFAQMRSGRAAYQNKVRDPFDLFGEAKARARAAPRVRKPKALEAKALETLGLSANSTGDQIKSRYKELVKLHHPDANGGDRGSEDRFRDVIQAYQLLKQAGFC